MGYLSCLPSHCPVHWIEVQLEQLACIIKWRGKTSNHYLFPWLQFCQIPEFLWLGIYSYYKLIGSDNGRGCPGWEYYLRGQWDPHPLQTVHENEYAFKTEIAPAPDENDETADAAIVDWIQGEQFANT